MVNISDAALDKAKEILNSEGKADWAFRFYTAGRSCCGPSYGIDIVENPEEEDQIIEKDGVKVFVDKTASESLSGMEIHYVVDGEREGFVINNPNPSSSCGPGCSSCG